MTIDPRTLREMFDYREADGALIWKRPNSPRVAVGSVAGTRYTKDGRKRVMVYGRNYAVYRVIWAVVHGEWPNGVIDHIDGDPSNDRLSNLREGGLGVNQENIRSALKNSQTGFLGVTKEGSRYAARIRSNRRLRRIGKFDTAEEAHAAYLAVKRQLHAGCTI